MKKLTAFLFGLNICNILHSLCDQSTWGVLASLIGILICLVCWWLDVSTAKLNAKIKLMKAGDIREAAGKGMYN